MNRNHSRARLTSGAALLGTAALIAAAATVVPASADDEAAGRPTARHEANGTVRGVMDHLIELEEIGDRHGGRASGTPGYEASRDYVVKRLSRAGYRPQVQEFDFPFFQQTRPLDVRGDRTHPAHLRGGRRLLDPRVQRRR